MVAKIKVTQIRKGKRVTFLTPDKGKPGKTPKDKQWYQPGVETGWKKDMPEEERRRLVLQAHKGDELASARSMQAKANVTTDRETKQRARADAQYFFRRHKVGKRPVTPAPKAEKVETVPEVPKIVLGKTEGKLWRRKGAGLYQEVLLEYEGEMLPFLYATDKAYFGSRKYPVAIDKMRYIRNSDVAPFYTDAVKLPSQLDKIFEAKIPKPLAVKEVKPKRDKGAVVSLQRLHARRSTQAQVRDEQQRHQVTVEPDSPKVKVWLKDPSAADIKGIDTPSARTLRRKGTPRITPRTPKLRR